MQAILTELNQLSHERNEGLQQLIEISQKYHENDSFDKFVEIEGEPKEQTIERLQKWVEKTMSTYYEYRENICKNSDEYYYLSLKYIHFFNVIEKEHQKMINDCFNCFKKINQLKKELNIEQDRIIADGLNVSYLTGKVIKCDYNPYLTGLELKLIIEEKEGYKVHQQRLIFKGKQIKDNETLDDHHIKENDTIRLNLQIR